MVPAEMLLVLIVDDEPDQRELMAESLELQGFRVSIARDGREALEMLASGELPAVIVMDLYMPILDGWETTKRVKQDARTSDVPIVVLSAHALGEHRVRARECGADAILTKPCVPAEL